MKYTEFLHLPEKTLQKYNALLSTQPENESECMGEDETIVNSVRFSNGYEMDIKICGVQFEIPESSIPYAEAVLFNKNGAEVACTDTDDTYHGEWILEADGDIYTCIVDAA